MDDDMPRNSIQKYLQQVFLNTMADGIMGKCGYVYQASNFYFGEKYWTQVYGNHPRKVKENAEFSGREKLFWMTSMSKDGGWIYVQIHLSFE